MRCHPLIFASGLVADVVGGGGVAASWAPRRRPQPAAESAGLRRRNAQLCWAMRGQDPLEEQRVPRRPAGLLGDRTPELQATGPAPKDISAARGPYGRRVP